MVVYMVIFDSNVQPMRRAVDCRYLLLEDADTGDMLMPLIYMKAVFEANYSRKLSALKHRLVTMPADAVLPDSRANAYLYWRWAFEAPPAVKLLVRQELGDDNTPQVGPHGHGCCEITCMSVNPEPALND